MADELPPLVELPGDVVEPSYGNRAAWFAKTFGGSDTNLAQRARHNADLTRFAAGAQAAQAAHQQQQIATDKTAQDLYFRQQQLDLQREKAAADMAIRHDVAATEIANKRSMIDLRAETAPLVMEAKRAQIAATGASTRLRALQDQRKATDTEDFSNHIAELIQRGVKPHTDEWSSGIAVGLSEFPHADPAMVRQYGASLFPREDLTPDEMIAKAHALRASDPNAVVRVTGKGTSSIVDPGLATVAAKEAAIETATQREARMAAESDSRIEHRDSTDLTKEIAAIEKARPAWRNTTGVFKDKNGVERFGKADLPWEESPIATPEMKAEHQRYQNLVLKRAAQDVGVKVKRFNPETGKIE